MSYFRNFVQVSSRIKLQILTLEIETVNL